MSRAAPPVSTTPYDNAFYDSQGAGSRRSAEVVLGLLFEWINPKSVVDVGCGEGHWLAVAMQMGASYGLGLDGEYVDRSRLVVPHHNFRAIDLSRTFRLERSFDLAISLEVAEHLDPGSENEFVASIIALAPIVLFSAAIPGQGGTDHRNEQWPSHWAGLFARHGFVCVDLVRPRLWHDQRVEFWYRQNTLLYLHQSHPLLTHPLIERSRVERPLDAGHPELLGGLRHVSERRLYWARHPGIRAAVRHLGAAMLRRARGNRH